MPSINRGCHFLLTEAVKKTASKNRLTDAVNIKITVSVNSPISEAVTLQWSTSVNRPGLDEAQ